MDTSKAQQHKPLTITRVIDAPREKVWKAWTDPEQLAKWWSPEGCTVSKCELVVRPEGIMHVDIQGPDGTMYPSVGAFKEVTAPDRLSFMSTPLDNDGNKLFEVLQNVTFKEAGGKTEIQIIAHVLSATPQAAPYLAGMEPGLNQALSKLKRLVQTAA